ncbi:MAG TPA: histidine kinase [Verrucomicrobiae bacterium]|nr:histidine kinase [Verrucomicrobiae bacterium]
MKRKLKRLSRGYATALHKHLKQRRQASLLPARELGRQAAAIGLETLDVARIHETALASLESSSRRDGIIKRAELFFAEAITPIERTHRAALKANAHLNQLHNKLGRRTADLAVSNRFLKQGIVQRKTVEQALKKSAKHYARLVKESRRLQKRLQHLAHQILTAQEEERTKISRELQDEIAQILLGINVRLLALKKEATINTEGLKKEIASTQGLVEKSVKTMSRFAREFGKKHDT